MTALADLACWIAWRSPRWIRHRAQRPALWMLACVTRGGVRDG